jgi:hypothetical protein
MGVASESDPAVPDSMALDPAAPIENKTDTFTIEPSKVIDLIISKQTQYYTLWGVYTAVQFAAGSYGSNQSLRIRTALAVFAGVWAFNLGHLGFVLRCVEQLDQLGRALTAALDNQQALYQERLHGAFGDMREGGFFWQFRERKGQTRSYLLNTAVHLAIDICASVALLSRVQWPANLLSLVPWI